MPKNLSKTQAAFERAKEVLQLGVSSTVRYWGDDTPVIERGEGAYIWDLDGNRYIDYRLAFGPIILGHAHPQVNQRVADQLAQGTLYAHTHMLEVEVAERIVRMCPGVEKVRFANSGTEATMHALRIARGFTGRERYIKFEGQYHGLHDAVMWSTGSATGRVLGLPHNPIPVASSAGMPRGTIQYISVVQYNDVETVERVAREQWNDLAAIIVEPILANGGYVMPEPGFLEQLRKLCDEYGIVLIFDEVKTGFRIAKGGATEYFGVTGDLMCYAKSIANGFPLAAIGGRAEVMEVVRPGGVWHGGTYAGNAVGTAAAAVTLEMLETTDALETIKQRGARLMSGIGDVLTEAGIEHVMTGHPAMFSFVVGRGDPVRNYRDVAESDMELYGRIGRRMHELGVAYEADPRDGWFLCAALSEADVDETLNRFNDAVESVK